ncbi:brain-specific angiogenesis inhibitor 1-associated protein 2 isoform X3 [Clupea harengus]|uniref:BAR/IMD domain-containing adapter protein 2 n=1 Tax=Clupea harengus TaxID=7950 RepID=A0A6P8F2D1_CLUHA|nr:brain-specific angiogenesis inhibitor 1-associated protein 2 isoform X3 [Clupea harengus]
MVIPEASNMSRTEEVHRITENVYKSIMEQFNPCLRNFVAMAKTYEKALSSVTFAAKGYFDALVRMGELASESHGSKDLEEAAWDVLFQMAEVHRQIQIQLEEMLRSFHNELLTELEKKVELDARYLNAALKKYQMEHKSKGESLERCQAELKKLRRKSQGSKHSSKYGDKEMQCVETISGKQTELDSYVADSYKAALSEERRRYCFLVDRQCAAAKNASAYHIKGKELLSHKLPMWQQACADPSKLPERAMLLAQQMTAGLGTLSSGGTLHSSKGGLHISDPIPGAKPLPVPAELAALMNQQRGMTMDGMPIVNGAGGAHGGDDYQHWMESKAAQAKAASAQAHRQGAEVYSNTLPSRKVALTKTKTPIAETQTLPRSSSMAAGLERQGRTRVQSIYSHAAGDNSTLLSFSEGDVITLLVPEARDGWHYGENEKNRMRGWFPFSYTRVIAEPDPATARHLQVRLQHGRSSSTGNLLERDGVALPVSDYGMSARLMAHGSQQSMAHGSQQSMAHGRQRPYSVAVPTYSQHQAQEEYEARFPTSSEVKLISTV